MKEFIFLIRLSPAPLQEDQTQLLRQQWGKLTTRLRAEEKFVDGYIFSPGGFTVEGIDARTVTNAATNESGLQAAGCVMIHAESMEEALQIARECPPLNFGGTVEVRERQPQPQPSN